MVAQNKKTYPKKSDIAGHGIFVGEDVKANQVIYYDAYIKVNFVNHSFAPNAVYDGDNLVASQDISKDSEITINYTDLPSGWWWKEFECNGTLVSPTKNA